MALPADKDKLIMPSAASQSPDLVNIVQAPLDACLVGEDWETLVDKVQFEKSRGDQSAYAPWLDLFPTLEDFQGMPRFWTPERREFVRTYDGGQLEARMELDQLRFNQVDDPWALAIVDSRSNFLPDNTYSMTPMLDMLNHDSSVKTSARVDGAERFLLEVDSKSIFGGSDDNNAAAKQPADWKDQLMSMLGGSSQGSSAYKPGGEVFVSYGDFDNMETLCNYGFVAENNVANTETFRVRLMGKAPAYLVIEPKGSVDNFYNQLSLIDLRRAMATTSEMENLSEWDGVGKMTDRNELETFALIAGELEEALYDAKSGAKEAEAMNDASVASYLRGREKTLEKGRDWVKARFPDVF
jgi:hypothetical protein